MTFLRQIQVFKKVRQRKNGDGFRFFTVPEKLIFQALFAHNNDCIVR